MVDGEVQLHNPSSSPGVLHYQVLVDVDAEEFPFVPVSARMGRRGWTCAAKALYLFNGERVLYKRPSIEELAKAASHSYYPCNPPMHRAVLAHGEQRDVSFLFYIRDEHGCAEWPVELEAMCDARRLLVVVHNDTVYPHGHCVVVHKREPHWYVQDPWRVDGRAVRMSRQQIMLCLAGASFVGST